MGAVKTGAVLIFLTAALVVLPACVPEPQSASVTPAAGAPASDLPPVRTVFLIVMENHNWADIKGSPSAPYLNQVLLPMSAYAEQYYNPPRLHPSEPNYLWLEAGTSFGITNDGLPAANHQSTTEHFVTQLERAGLRWKSYQEGIAGTECPLQDAYPYAPKHNPMVFFDDVTSGNQRNSASCIAHVRPFSELAADLTANTVADYNFITPDLCHDMHDACPPTGNAIKQGDDWLSVVVPQILRAPAYTNGGALFITWDEGENGSDGPIGMILLSPFGKGNGYASRVRYSHSSTLRTLQEIFHVTPVLRDATLASALCDLFERGSTPSGAAPLQAPTASPSGCPGAAHGMALPILQTLPLHAHAPNLEDSGRRDTYGTWAGTLR